MWYDAINSECFPIIKGLLFVAGILFGTVLLIVIFEFFLCAVRKYSDRQRWETAIIKQKRRIKQVFCVFILFPVVGIILITAENTYGSKGTYSWDKISNPDNSDAFFAIEKSVSKKAVNEVLHYNWFHNDLDSVEDGTLIIDRETINKYKRNTKTLSLFQNQKDKEKIPLLSNNGISNQLQEFDSYVQKNHQYLSEQECMKGYLLGKQITEIIFTSEYIFQTGVFAESAHSKAFESDIINEESVLAHLEGAIRNFESFLKFTKRDAGGNKIIKASEIYFRMGKILYRQGIYADNNANQKSAKHLILFAYSCFECALEEITEDDREYIVYLYYYNLVCRELFNYINDSALIEELCKEKLKTLENIDKLDFSIYETEGYTKEEMKDEIKKLKVALEDEIE